MTTTEALTGRKTGHVIHFNSIKFYGFLREQETGQRVFFHVNDYGKYVCDGGDTPAFVGLGVYEEPPKGLLMTFEVVQTPRGPAARMVGLEDNYRKALADIANRPTYRFVRRTGDHPRQRLFTGNEFKYTTMWYGEDLRDLRKKFRKDWWATTDQCPGRVCYYFESLDENGDWNLCEDPR
jgi:hypothetical protein